MTQSRVDSFMESLCNIAVGIGVSFAANLIIIPLVLDVDISVGDNLTLGVFYTMVSLARSYIIRRAFNGRSVWQSFHHLFKGAV